MEDDPGLVVPRIKNDEARQTERLWGQHNIGHLKKCAQSHVYSARTFSNGCPDCGKRVPTLNIVYRDPSKFLFEKKFLEAMHADGSKPASSFAPAASTQAYSSSPECGIESPLQDVQATTQVEEAAYEEKSLDGIRKVVPVAENHDDGIPAAPDKEKRASEQETQSTSTACSVDRNSSLKSEISSKPAKELSNEEKFLAAMRKLGSTNNITAKSEEDLSEARHQGTHPVTAIDAKPSVEKETKSDVATEVTTNEERFVIAMRKLQSSTSVADESEETKSQTGEQETGRDDVHVIGTDGTVSTKQTPNAKEKELNEIVPRPAKELTNEERFLMAMRKLGDK